MSMTSSHVIFWAIGAALIFWMVGAYNRLVRLRGDIVRQFAPVDGQLKLRQALLRRQIDALAPMLANAGPRLDALRAACQQTELAGALAKLKPAAADSVTLPGPASRRADNVPHSPSWCPGPRPALAARCFVSGRGSVRTRLELP